MGDYLVNNVWQIWAAVAVLCLIAELFTSGFYIVCFSVGSLAAMAASCFVGVYPQLVVFIVFSAVSIFMVRPFALRWLHRDDVGHRTNADALIGRVGTVSQEIPADGYGRVSVGGDDWKAEAEGGVAVAAGTRVKVVGRESVIIKVTSNIN